MARAVRSPWARGALAGVLFAAVAFVVLLPATAHCSTLIDGRPGDATTGGVWPLWQYRHLAGLPWSMVHSPFTSAPGGEPLWLPLTLPSITVVMPMWVLAHLAAPVCAWNLTLVLGFALTGATTFVLFDRMVRRTDVALVGAFAYTFSAYRLLKAEAHVGNVYAWPFPLLLLACFALWRDPRPRYAVLAGAALALLCYTDPYYVLLAPVTVGTLAVVAMVHAARTAGSRGRRVWPVVRALMLAGAVAALLTVPLAATFVRSESTVSNSVSRRLDELFIYSARAHEYLLPSARHPLFGHLFGSWQRRHRHFSNDVEQTLYLGWTVIGLAGTALVAGTRARRRDDGTAPFGLPMGAVVAALAALAAVALAFSAPPASTVFGVVVNGPSTLVFRVAKLWRVYARFFIVAHLALVALATLGLAHLARARRGGARLAVTATVTVLVAFEFLTFPPRRTFSYANAPPEVAWLARQPHRLIVAEYPMTPPPSHNTIHYLTWQPVHEHPLVNVWRGNTPEDFSRRGLYGLADRQTAPALRALRAGIVLVHTDRYHPAPPTPPPGFDLVRSFASGARAYRVTPGPPGRALLAVGVGFSRPHAGHDWHGLHYLRDAGELTLVPLAPGVREATVSFDALPARGRGPFTMVVSQGNTVLWTGRIDGRVHVSFPMRTGEAAVVSVAGRQREPQPLPDGLTASELRAAITDLGVDASG